MDICLDVTLHEEGTSRVPGSNKFDLVIRALIGHQNTLLAKAMKCPNEEKEMVPEILQDVITTNEMLSELINSGFPEVFNLQFYRNRQ